MIYVSYELPSQKSMKYVFTKGRLCQTNIFLDKGNSVDLIYLDFSKASDMVAHGEITN